MGGKTIWIVNEYNGPYEGVTRQTILSQRLEEQGYTVYIISGSACNRGTVNYVQENKSYVFEVVDDVKHFVIKTNDYHRNCERALVALQFQYKLWRIKEELPQPDVIVSDFAGWFGNVFLKWKRKYGTKIIYDILDLWPEGFVDMGYLKKNSPITKMLYQLEHKAYKNADGIIFSFAGGKDYLVDKGWSKDVGGDVDTSDIGYLNNGVDIKLLDSYCEKYVLEDDDLNSSKFKAIYVGSISSFNGLDILIDVAEKLRERNENNIDILIFGNGNQEERLKKTVNDLKLTNIKFKGALDKRYAMGVLKKSDVNIFTFIDTPLLKYGTSPNKLFLYFASGKPVLSMIRPKYDLVEDNKCGISVENNFEEVVDALIKFTKMDKSIYNEYCINARKTAEEYDYNTLVNELIRFVERKA